MFFLIINYINGKENKIPLCLGFMAIMKIQYYELWPKSPSFFYKSTIFYKPELVSTTTTFFVEIATISYNLVIFFNSLATFSTNHNFFLQPWIFYQQRAFFFVAYNFFLQNTNFFYNLATFLFKSQFFYDVLTIFYNSQPFYKSQQFSTIFFKYFS